MDRETYDLATTGMSAANRTGYHKSGGIGWIGIMPDTSHGPILLGAGYTLAAARQASRKWRAVVAADNVRGLPPICDDEYRLAYGQLFKGVLGRTNFARERGVWEALDAYDTLLAVADYDVDGWVL